MADKWIIPKNWIPLVGQWEFSGNKTNLKGTGLTKNLGPLGLCLCNGRLKNGKISCKVTIMTEKDVGKPGQVKVVFGYDSTTKQYYGIGIRAWENAFAFQKFIPKYGHVYLTGDGDKNIIELKKEYLLEVIIKGNKVSLYVDNILILNYILEEPLLGDQIGLFTWEDVEIEISDYKYFSDDPVFVIMKLGDVEPYFSLYKDVIEPICKDFNLNVVKGDELFSEHGVILTEITNRIDESRFIIAEISPPNPNVFYELGYAQAKKIPTILLALKDNQKDNQLPFDVQGNRVIFYEDSIKGKNAVERDLKKYLDNLVNGGTIQE
ncbi:MAG: hypothetical protein HPY53_00555 [Brevinematales bacterium]|nr:hypothetical protein [Brevinematales bacterium]